MSYDSDSSYLDSETEINDRLTEQGTDRWSRLPTNGIPGENDFFKGDGTPNTRYLALGDDAKIPVFDELTAWMKRNNKIPADEVFQARSGHHPEDTVPNFEAAERRFGLDIPLQGVPADAEDRRFYDRWSETLDFRWNYDFADLRLRRARRYGWKWRLIRLRPNGTVVISPFIKPAQTPFRERGLKSSDASVARVSSSSLLDRMRKQAQARWRGMPITDKEEREDEARIRNLRFIEGLKNNYGFMGEMLCGMGNDTGSGVAILAIGAVVIYLILFIYGPLEMVPYLAEFVTTVLPLQGTMKGIVTSARDALRQSGEDYTEGNVRQWLLYWPFARTLSFFQGWIYLVRPNWYRAICGWRTLLCAACASPFFNDRSLHPADLKESRRRLLKKVWRERGEKMAQENILFELEERKASANKASKISQGKGANGGTRFNAMNHAQEVLAEARMLHGFIEESWQGGHFPDPRGRPSASGLRSKIMAFAEFMSENGLDKTSIESLDREKQDQFESMLGNLEKAVGRGYIHTRTTGGSEAFKGHLKRIYGATDETLAEFMKTLSVERGVIGSRTDGMAKARADDALRGQHRPIQRRGVRGPDGNLVVEGEKPFWEPDYKYDDNKALSADVKQLDDLYLAAAGGDKSAQQQIQDQTRLNSWQSKLNNAGFGIGGEGDPSRSRIGFPAKDTHKDHGGWAPNMAFGEDLSGLVAEDKRHPGTGIAQRPGQAGYTDRNFMFRHRTQEQEEQNKQQRQQGKK